MIEKNKTKKFIKKFYRSVTTHLSKQIKFSTNFKNMGRILPCSENDILNQIPRIVFVLTKNSKIDLNDANRVMYMIFELRTFDDLNIQKELCEQGIKITFSIDNIKYQFLIIIFKTYDFADNILKGYQTNDGMKYSWIGFIDYNIHPSLVLHKYTNDFHKVLQSKIQCDADIMSDINWTEEILKEKIPYVEI